MGRDMAAVISIGREIETAHWQMTHGQDTRVTLDSLGENEVAQAVRQMAREIEGLRPEENPGLLREVNTGNWRKTIEQLWPMHCWSRVGEVCNELTADQVLERAERAASGPVQLLQATSKRSDDCRNASEPREEETRRKPETRSERRGVLLACLTLCPLYAPCVCLPSECAHLASAPNLAARIAPLAASPPAHPSNHPPLEHRVAQWARISSASRPSLPFGPIEVTWTCHRALIPRLRSPLVRQADCRSSSYLSR